MPAMWVVAGKEALVECRRASAPTSVGFSIQAANLQQGFDRGVLPTELPVQNVCVA